MEIEPLYSLMIQKVSMIDLLMQKDPNIVDIYEWIVKLERLRHEIRTVEGYKDLEDQIQKIESQLQNEIGVRFTMVLQDVLAVEET